MRSLPGLLPIREWMQFLENYDQCFIHATQEE